MIMVEYDRNHSHRPSHYHSQSREAAHLQHLDHHSAPSTPSPPYQYAPLPSYGPQHQQPPTSVRSTPTSYPSPASYPSPSSMSSYSYPPQGHNSPHYQPLSLPSYSLPPIRMTPPSTSLPPVMSGSQIGSPLPPPPAPPLQYYHPHGHQLSAPPAVPHGHLTSSPLHQPLRYPLPHVPPERIMSGGRHKKEIKRRTKTGCLTCRKRRIKCDEAHPTCKNCAKSKRDCMGYDPIFKTQPGPAAIQPAPSSGGSIPSFQSSNPSLSYAVSNSSVGGSSYPISTAGSSPRSSSEPYEYPPIIDPSLESSTQMPPTTAGANVLAEAPANYRPDLKRPIDRTSPFSCTSDTPRTSATPVLRSDTPNHSLLRDGSLTGHPAKRIKIDDLLLGGSNALPLTPPAMEHSLSSEVFKDLYRSKYAPMMDELLETGWFETRGVARIIRGGNFTDMLSALFSRLRARGESYMEEEDSSLVNVSGDAGILMNCIHLIYGTQPLLEDNRAPGRDDDHADASDIAKREETAKRIAVLEALVTGKFLAVNLASPQSSPRSSPRQYEDPHIGLSSKFWRSLARFLSIKEGRDFEIEQALEDMYRNISEIKSNSNREPLENKKASREALYNIALARHLHTKLNSSTMEKPESAEDRRRYQSDFDKAKSIVVGNARTFDSESYLPRICGRAVGIWAEPITETTV